MSNEQAAPLWSDENIANDAKRASSNPTIQATIRSCLLFMRYGYEAERQRLTQANAELAAEVERLKAEAATYISFEIDRFEHGEDGSRNGQRHYYARIRYQAMTGCDYEED